MYYFKGWQPNFGDELNPWLWPRIFGDIWHETDRELFLGIGSILYDRWPADRPKIVFGAGYGAYGGGPPNVHDGSWDVFFVRGPQTAEWLGLAPGFAITDAAILVRTVALPPAAAPIPIGFMPHFQSLKRGNWERVCARAGITLIDPRAPVETVLSQIQACKLLLTEAMHGAIVADALRVPWIALRPIVSQHHFKWLDWCRSIRLDYAPHAMPPSSFRELWISAGIGEAQGRFSTGLAAGVIGKLADAALIPLAARRLRRLASETSCLSSDATTAELTARVLEQVARFKAKYVSSAGPVHAADPTIAASS